MHKGCGLRVTSIEINPYLNVDAGTMNPFEEHGKTYWELLWRAWWGSLCSRDNSVIENMLFVLEKAFKKLPEAESVTSAINRNNDRVMSSLAKNSEYPSCLASPLLLIQAC